MTVTENLLFKLEDNGVAYSSKAVDAGVNLTYLDSMKCFGDGHEKAQIENAAKALDITPLQVRQRLNAGEKIIWG